MDLLRARNWKSRNFFVYVLIIQIITYIVLTINVPIARQVISFFYLTFVPGMVILKLLKLQNLDWTETTLFSVGLSLAFLMITGLLINELSPLIGLSAPLSEGSLIVVISVIVILLSFFGFLTGKDHRFPVTRSLEINPLALLFVGLPLLSVLGATAVNAFGNNLILLLMIIAVSVTVVLGALSEKLFSPKLYSLALLMIAVALLFHTSLISNHINGYDIHTEYYVFKLTRDKTCWNSTFSVPRYPEYARYNAMLSITVLPTIYSVIMNMNETWTLKIVYPLIFSFVSLGLYKLFQMRVQRKVAFLSTFFFMSLNVFFTEMLGLGRQMIAEVFFILLFFVLFSKKMSYMSKMVCFMIFSFALTVSHYAVSYIFFFLIFFTWLSSVFLKKWTGKIKASTVVLFFVMTFSWYIYISASKPFDAIVSISDNILRTLTIDFFNPASRGQLVLRGIGLETPQSLGHLISRIFAYATQFFIVIGFFTLLIKRKKISDHGYLVMSSLNMALLIMSIVLPYFAMSLQITRLYHIVLVFLAPLCLLGGEIFLKFILKLKTEFSVSALILLILIPFFLFQINFIFEVTGDDSWSIPLSKYRMDGLTLYYAGFLDERDIFSAQWLSKNMDIEHGTIYADLSTRALTSYGMVPRSRIEELSNTTKVIEDGAVYLGRANIIDGVVFGRRGTSWNTTEFSSMLGNMSKIYSNGAGEINKNG